MTPETKFKNEVEKWLMSERIYPAGTPAHKMTTPIKGWYVKIWGGGMQKEGIPDILMNVNGYFVSLELKSAKGRPSELQKKNTKMINQACGYGVVLYPNQFDDFKELIHCLEDGKVMKACKITTMINERWDK